MLAQKATYSPRNLFGERSVVMYRIEVKVLALVQLYVGQPQDVGTQLSLCAQILHECIAVFAPEVWAELLVGMEQEVVAKVVFVGRYRLPHENRAYNKAISNGFNHFLVRQPSVGYLMEHKKIRIISVLFVSGLGPRQLGKNH